MADNGGGGGAGMGLMVGALAVVVAVIGVVVFTGGNFGQSKTMDVNIKPPPISAPSAPAAK
ncbi:hypothetical protein ACO2Q3_14865 [Caulobacter sp. KR2-114]|uniref:hypothetical protein n=1 Tax=Caulobacter sp. KR2-114 TaxID=3400912 RepID=UPI003BFD9AA3